MYFLVIESLQSLDFIIHSPHPYDERVRTKRITVTREEIATDIQQAEMAIFDFIAEFQNMTTLFIENVKKQMPISIPDVSKL
jgi:DNA-binding MarR family transcriptional regulator